MINQRSNNAKAYNVRIQQLISELLSKAIPPQIDRPRTQTENLTAFNEIYAITEKIRFLQSTENAVMFPNTDRKQFIEPFMQWLKSNKVPVQSLPIRVEPQNQNSNELCVKCIRPFNADELVFSVPRNLFMTTETALRNPTLARLVRDEKLLLPNSNVLLSMHLLEEKAKGTKSFWFPYIQMLPHSYNNVLYLRPSEMVLLKHSAAFEESVKLYRNICRHYAFIYNTLDMNAEFRKLKCAKHFTFDSYRWACSAVMTRQNLIPSTTSNSLVNAFVPLWDLINHEHGQHSTAYDDQEQQLMFYAKRDFESGEEIKNFYGVRSSFEFLFHNGFVDSNPTHDYMIIKLGIAKSDKLLALKTQILSELKVPIHGDFRLLHQKNEADPSTIAFLRVFHMTQDELEQLQKEGDLHELKDVKPNEEPFKQLDSKWAQFMSVRAKLLLRTYENANQAAITMTQQLTNIMQLLRIEQQILTSYVI